MSLPDPAPVRSPFAELEAIDGAERPGSDRFVPLGPRVLTRSTLARLGALAEALWREHAATLRGALASRGARELALELGFSEQEAALIARTPSSIPAPVRGDFVRTQHGFRLLEWNVDPCLGGIAGEKVFAAFRRAGGARDLVFCDPAAALTRVLARLEGVSRIAIALRDCDASRWGTNAERYAEIARAAGLDAKVMSVEQAARLARHSRHADPLGILRGFHFEHVASVRAPLEDILDLAAEGRAQLLFGFDTELWGDKQWLGRGSWPEELGEYVPETRSLAEVWREVLGARSEWVLKPHAGAAGSGVVAGIDVDDARWNEAVHAARRVPGSIAQRFQTPLSRHAAYLDTSSGFELRQRELETIGIFLVDGRFSGAYARSQPVECGSVIDAESSFNVVATRRPKARAVAEDSELPREIRRAWLTPTRGRAKLRLRAFEDLAVEHLGSHGGRRANAGAEEARLGFPGAAWPDDACPLRQIQREIRTFLMPFCHDKRDRSYFAHMDVPPADLSIAAGELIRALGQDPVTWTSSRAGTFVEREVIAWFGALAYADNPAAGGVATSGGTQANLQAILIARNLALGSAAVAKLGVAEALRRSGFSNLKILASEKAHLSVAAAVRHAGLGDDHHVRLPVDEDDAVRLDALEAALEAAERAGDRVALVVLNAGSVGVGAVDPLRPAIAIAQRHGARVHVDAAHGSLMLFSRRHRALLDGIEQADSVTCDPHKVLGLNQGLGLLLLKNAGDLEATAKEPAPYFLAPNGAPENWRFALDGTRPLNALGAWILMRHFGRAGYEKIVDHFMALAQAFESELRARGDFELYGRRDMNLVAFRPRGAGEREVDALIARINAGRFRASRYQSARGSFVRAVFVNPASTRADALDYVAELRRLCSDSGDAS